MPALRSNVTTRGRNAAGARALWRATGMVDEDFGKPIVAIANPYTQFVPGHATTTTSTASSADPSSSRSVGASARDGALVSFRPVSARIGAITG